MDTDSRVEQARTLTIAGYCRCWWSPVSLHDGHCCIRAGRVGMASGCVGRHPLTAEVRALYEAQREAGLT